VEAGAFVVLMSSTCTTGGGKAAGAAGLQPTMLKAITANIASPVQTTAKFTVIRRVFIGIISEGYLW
jgi:hypothetical protein